MKCISLWQPWAFALFVKDHENVRIKPDETRPWQCHLRERVFIHASAKRVKPGRDFPENLMLSIGLLFPHGGNIDELPYGCIIGHGLVVSSIPAVGVRSERTPLQLMWGDYRHIGDDGKIRYAITIDDTVLLPTPIPWTG